MRPTFTLSLFIVFSLTILSACGPARSNTPSAPTGTPTQTTPEPSFTPSPSPSPIATATPPVPAGQFMVSVSKPHQSVIIYGYDMQQGKPVTLTDEKSNNWDPVWSLDGTKIIFGSDRDGQQELYSMNPDGSAQTRLTHNEVYKLIPQLSPDGKKIAFVDQVIPDGPPPPRAILYVVNADGSDMVQVTERVVYPYTYRWSPDSTRLLFTQNVEHRNELMIVRADGTGLKSLSPGSGDAGQFSFSPDGQQLVYSFLTAGQKTCQLLIVNLDGGPGTVVYDSSTGPVIQPVRPMWTRANQILFVEGRQEDQAVYDTTKLYRIDLDGRNLARVAAEKRLRWVIGPSSDGKQVALVVFFNEGEARYTEIEVMDLDGTNARQVTHMGMYFNYAIWSPDGQYFNVFANPTYRMESPYTNWVISLDGSVKREISDFADLMEVEWRP